LGSHHPRSVRGKVVRSHSQDERPPGAASYTIPRLNRACLSSRWQNAHAWYDPAKSSSIRAIPWRVRLIPRNRRCRTMQASWRTFYWLSSDEHKQASESRHTFAPGVVGIMQTASAPPGPGSVYGEVALRMAHRTRQDAERWW